MKSTGFGVKNKASALLSRVNKVTALVIALSVVIVCYTIFATLAAASFAAFEVENATLSDGAFTGSDTNASNGKYAQLGSGTTAALNSEANVLGTSTPSSSLCGTWSLQQVTSMTELDNKTSLINSSLAFKDMRGFSLRVSWKSSDTDMSLYEKGRDLARAKNLDYSVRFMSGRHTPARIFDAGAYYYVVDGEKIPKPFSNTGVGGNPVFEREYEAYVSKMATWSRQNGVKVLHLPWYGFKWAEIYHDAELFDEPGYSYDAWLTGHKRLIDIALKYAGPDLAVEFPLSGHWGGKNTGGQDIVNYMLSKTGEVWSPKIYVQGNGLGVYNGKPTQKEVFHAMQMYDGKDYDWKAIFDHLKSSPQAVYAEIYTDSFGLANKSQLQSEITSYKQFICPASTTPPPAPAAATTTVNIPATGTYKVWSRIMAPDTTNNSYTLQIDSGTATTVGDTAIPANTWTWVSGPASVSLSQGNRTFKLTARENSVKVDRLIATTDTSCVPTGTGSNCATAGDTTSPAVSISSPTAGSTVSGTVNINATATDAVGVTKVEFYIDGALKSTDSTSPYSHSWYTTNFANSSHSLMAKAYDAAGNVGSSSTVTVTVNNADTQAPSMPTGLSSPSQTASSVSLAWTASTDNVAVTGYKVYRNGTQVGTTAAASYTDSGLAASTAYSYRVSAYDAAGNESAQTAALTVTTKAAPDTTAPTAPTSLTTNNVKYNSVGLSWIASTDNVGVVKYLVQRGGVTIAEVTTTSYTDNTVAANTQYSYVVRAVDAAGNTSAASNTQTVTTPNPPDTTAPTVPAGLSATPVSSDQVNLAWTASTDNIGVTGYQIYRNGTQVGTSTTTSYGDTGLTANTAYTYTVRAYDAAGNVSAASAAVSATTLNTSGGLTGTTGVWAEYYANVTLSGPPVVGRQENQINYDWAMAAPVAGIPSDNFSARWTGQVRIATSGSYTFYTQSDDGVRLWVNDQLVIDNWTTHASKEDKATITLNPGDYNIRLEYFDKSYGAVIKLQWSGPGVSKQVIPQASLLPQQYGLTGSYYSDKTLTNFVFQRLDSTVGFAWDSNAPDSLLSADNFSTRWTGQVYVPTTGSYTFYTNSDDGIRLWVNSKQIINNWTNHAATENSGTITLTGGQKYNVILEYYEDRYQATAQLLWSGPSTTKQVISKESLRDRW